ncbi:nonstructural protein 3 [Galliform chaphamaparvovirus 7]|nr:nonstructural protein 3 [Galliform chaphamaparvovirus 7]
MASPGFSVLAWVKDDSSMLQQIVCPNQEQAIQARQNVEQQLLRDFQTLLSVRWQMDVTLLTIHDHVYAYGINKRFNVSAKTIERAIGELIEHVEFLRSTPEFNAEDLVRYKECRAKWSVPEQVSDTSFGPEASVQAETSQSSKRKRY